MEFCIREKSRACNYLQVRPRVPSAPLEPWPRYQVLSPRTNRPRAATLNVSINLFSSLHARIALFLSPPPLLPPFSQPPFAPGPFAHHPHRTQAQAPASRRPRPPRRRPPSTPPRRAICRPSRGRQPRRPPPAPAGPRPPCPARTAQGTSLISRARCARVAGAHM